MSIPIGNKTCDYTVIFEHGIDTQLVSNIEYSLTDKTIKMFVDDSPILNIQQINFLIREPNFYLVKNINGCYENHILFYDMKCISHTHKLSYEKNATSRHEFVFTFQTIKQYDPKDDNTNNYSYEKWFEFTEENFQDLNDQNTRALSK